MMATVMGLGDLVFVAMFLAASRRFGLSLWKAFALVLVGLGLAVAVAIWTGAPVPALPFICVLFLIGNARDLVLNRREWIMTATITAVVLLLGLANYFGRLLMGG